MVQLISHNIIRSKSYIIVYNTYMSCMCMSKDEIARRTVLCKLAFLFFTNLPPTNHFFQSVFLCSWRSLTHHIIMKKHSWERREQSCKSCIHGKNVKNAVKLQLGTAEASWLHCIQHALREQTLNTTYSLSCTLSKRRARFQVKLYYLFNQLDLNLLPSLPWFYSILFYSILSCKAGSN